MPTLKTQRFNPQQQELLTFSQDTALSSIIPLSLPESTQVDKLEPQASSLAINQTNSYDKLNQLFGDKAQEHKTILEAREILAKDAEKLSDEQVYNLVNEVQYLVDTWLEEFEKGVFNGKTLNELLNIKNP